MALVEKDKGAPFDNGPIGPEGQYRDYAILPQSERDKGFVRPVRRSYKHIGPQGPKYPLRDLTPEEIERYVECKYVKFEMYPESEAPKVGKFWTQEELDKVGKGCRSITTMGPKLAETYARDPKFYGATFCCACGVHLPVDEFVWLDSDLGKVTNERVGS